MQQPNLPLDGLDIRDVAYYAEIAVHRSWDAAAHQALAHLANTGEPFTSDDFRRLMADAPEPHHPNTIGSFFRHAHATGLIEPTGVFRQATTPSRHGAAIREWIGTTTQANTAA